MKTKNKKPPHLEWIDGKEKPCVTWGTQYIVWMDSAPECNGDFLDMACGYFHEDSWWVFEVDQEITEPLFDIDIKGLLGEEARSAVFTKVTKGKVLAWAELSAGDL